MSPQYMHNERYFRNSIVDAPRNAWKNSSLHNHDSIRTLYANSSPPGIIHPHVLYEKARNTPPVLLNLADSSSITTAISSKPEYLNKSTGIEMCQPASLKTSMDRCLDEPKSPWKLGICKRSRNYQLGSFEKDKMSIAPAHFDENDARVDASKQEQQYMLQASLEELEVQKMFEDLIQAEKRPMAVSALVRVGTLIPDIAIYFRKDSHVLEILINDIQCMIEHSIDFSKLGYLCDVLNLIHVLVGDTFVRSRLMLMSLMDLLTTILSKNVSENGAYYLMVSALCLLKNILMKSDDTQVFQYMIQNDILHACLRQIDLIPSLCVSIVASILKRVLACEQYLQLICSQFFLTNYIVTLLNKCALKNQKDLQSAFLKEHLTDCYYYLSRKPNGLLPIILNPPPHSIIPRGCNAIVFLQLYRINNYQDKRSIFTEANNTQIRRAKLPFSTDKTK